MQKPAPTDHPVHELIRERWSPRAFADRSVEPETLASLFEAARWSASCFNEQPWAYLVARREDKEAFTRLLGCLVPGNQAWAKGAAVLALSVAKRAFDHDGRPNRHAFHDVGQAAAQLTFEATARGLRVHQMAGFDVEKARTEHAIPAGWDPVAAIAIGYPADPKSLSDDVRERENAPRKRKPITDFVFAGKWGTPC